MGAVTRYARKHNLRRPIRRILLSGEQLPEDLREELTEYWQAEVYDSYGTTELGGGQSLSFPGCTGFHLNDLHVITEIVDPQTGKPADEGEMVFTTLMREAMPLIRYRSGDRARWIDCPCKLPFRSIEIMGRTDDMIVAGDMNLYGNIIADAIGRVDGANGRIEIVVERQNQTDHMTVRVEGDGVQEEHVRRVLYEVYPELAESVNNGVFALMLESNVKLASQAKALKIRDSRRNGKSHNVMSEAAPAADSAVA
jgi:phenylacetate-CoA ligase